MTRALVLKALSTKTITIMLVSLVFSILFAVSMPTQARAAALTDSQIKSILSLLEAFGADQKVINNVNTALKGGKVTTTTSVNPTQTSSVKIYSFTVSPRRVNEGTGVTFVWRTNLQETDISNWGGYCKITALTRATNRQFDITIPSQVYISGSITYTPTETASYYLRCTSGSKMTDPRVQSRPVAVEVIKSSTGSTATTTNQNNGSDTDDDEDTDEDENEAGPGGSSDDEDSDWDQDSGSHDQVSDPTVRLTVSPDAVNFGKKSTLTWASTDATSCTLSYGATYEKIATAGKKKVIPTASENTFMVTCTNAKGVSASNVVSVQVTYPKPSCTLVASETLVEKGDTVTLKWTSKNATSASKTGTKNVERGSVKVKANDQMRFEKTFTGPGGSVTCYAKVNLRDYGTWILENAKQQVVMAPGSAVLGVSTDGILTGAQHSALAAVVAAFAGLK